MTTVTKESKRILSVTVRREVDSDPDTSWLGEYVRQDYERMESLNRGYWCFMGVFATAEVQLSSMSTIQTLRSGGLWGIESDSGDYFKEVEAEQLAELKDEMHAAGFSKRAIAAAFRKVEHSDD